MVKKRVPDWLNSPLWYSAPPPPAPEDDDDVRLYSTSSAPTISSPSTSKSATTTTNSATASAVTTERPKVEIRDPYGNNDSSDYDRSPTSAEDVSLLAQLELELSRKVVNMGELQRVASQGIPGAAGIRSTVWKLLLGYLPMDRGLWSSELVKKRSQYKHFKEELLMNPSEITRRLEKSSGFENEESKCVTRVFLSRSAITHGEHPLSLGKTSIWNLFFQDSEFIEQIDRDVKRTHPDMQFFSGESQFAKSNQALAEADTFFCFVELISGFRDLFCQQLDNSVAGIRSTISKLSKLLKEHDEELWRHLEVTTKVNPQFYAFRWITLLLTQEFDFADSLMIWDALLSDPEGPQETLLRICCAMLILVRRRLLAGDFTANLTLLQHYPSANIRHLLYVGNKLRKQLPL
ncbi:uncharacterized protein LOC131299435 isoform X2 [Rhododendron vialii]|uniref:uncharacterized protein LOC131299435 isoform X2 n=1 Tax=Rhododendron vialii TaxID=182163 RepID=UPI00265D9905|nr:uncharacterized protein LOC131299435 isoform X2 [Rhododendron vialii]